jgi:sarcosine oxidase
MDVIIAGLGAMGSAGAFHLARRGARVIGFDRFAPPHTLGSSHGKSRIIREAYFEDPCYVPLVHRAFENWTALERLSDTPLLVRTGGLMLGPPDSAVVAGALASAERHDLPHELLSPADIMRRFPAVRPMADMIGVFEPRAGYLVPELAIAAHLEFAARARAELHMNEPVIAWAADGDGVEVTTTQGRYTADRLVLATGAWVNELMPLPVQIERNVIYWFRPPTPTPQFDVGTHPVIICEYTPGHAWYGFPDSGDGVKVGLHHDHPSAARRVSADPNALRRDVGDDEIAYMRALVRTFLPRADGELVDAAVCMYTNAPDDHFIIDTHPQYPQVEVVSPCSGHGFKFASAIGELVADRILTGRTTLDLSPFRLARLAS